ncbi:MAG: VOC family protein [Pyrinomonadaceae bacterium]
MQLTGLHHVTAVTAHAAENLKFYTEVLGLRLVKKTVNQDDVSAYHLFYGDEKGNPGTEVTFFDWGFAAPRHHGTGTISEIGLRVPDAHALEWWHKRFEEYEVKNGVVDSRNTRASLPFSDSEGAAPRCSSRKKERVKYGAARRGLKALCRERSRFGG